MSKVIYCPHLARANSLQSYCMMGKFPPDCGICDCKDKQFIEEYSDINTRQRYMSKADEQALKFYPVLFSEREGYDKTDIQKERRNAFANGWEKAEKNLRLTWQDVRRLIQIANQKLYALDYEKVMRMGEEAYYTEILTQFKQ